MQHTGSGHWDVYSSDGMFLRSFTLPEGNHLSRLRGDLAVTHGLDMTDSPIVRIYRVRR
jgi:hypothetical protein